MGARLSVRSLIVIGSMIDDFADRLIGDVQRNLHGFSRPLNQTTLYLLRTGIETGKEKKVSSVLGQMEADFRLL